MNGFYKQLLLIFDKHNAYLVRKGKAITKFGDVETSKPQWIMASTLDT